MFDFVTESFDLEKTNEYILSIQITLDGFSFSIFSANESKIIAFKPTPLKISSDNLIVHHFEDWIKKEEILQKKYSKTNIVYFSTEFSLLPENMFSSQLVKAATNRLIDENEQKHFETNDINKLESPAKIVFYLPKNLKEVVNKYFPSSQLIHPVQLIIEQSPQGNKKNKVVILYTKNNFLMVVSRNQQVLFANGFSIQHINDLVYFLLNTIVQLNINLKETDLYISDALIKNDEIEGLLNPYFNEISYLPPSGLIENTEMIQHSLHRYFSFN